MLDKIYPRNYTFSGTLSYIHHIPEYFEQLLLEASFHWYLFIFLYGRSER